MHSLLKSCCRSAAGQDPARAQALRARTPACGKVLRANARRFSSATGTALRTPRALQSKPHRHRRRDKALRALKQRGPESPACAQAPRAKHRARQKTPLELREEASLGFLSGEKNWENPQKAPRGGGRDLPAPNLTPRDDRPYPHRTPYDGAVDPYLAKPLSGGDVEMGSDEACLPTYGTTEDATSVDGPESVGGRDTTIESMHHDDSDHRSAARAAYPSSEARVANTATRVAAMLSAAEAKRRISEGTPIDWSEHTGDAVDTTATQPTAGATDVTTPDRPSSASVALDHIDWDGLAHNFGLVAAQEAPTVTIEWIATTGRKPALLMVPIAHTGEEPYRLVRAHRRRGRHNGDAAHSRRHRRHDAGQAVLRERRTRSHRLGRARAQLRTSRRPRGPDCHDRMDRHDRTQARAVHGTDRPHRRRAMRDGLPQPP